MKKPLKTRFQEAVILTVAAVSLGGAAAKACSKEPDARTAVSPKESSEFVKNIKDVIDFFKVNPQNPSP